MVGLYICECGVEFVGYGLLFCLFCGRELKYVGKVLGLSEEWRDAKVIRFRRL